MQTKKSIAVVGMGNLHSVTRALEYVCPSFVSIELTHNVQTIADADAVLFPGQGAAASCMTNLQSYEGLTHQLLQASEQKPFLGICMGMQVLFTKSEENEGVNCLNKVAGTVKPFDFKARTASSQDMPPLKIPHMGWNSIEQTKQHPLWHNIPDHSNFYFVHSYYCECQQPQNIYGTTQYGHPFTSVIANKNYFAIQAHPEKSGDVGLQLLRNFVETI